MKKEVIDKLDAREILACAMSNEKLACQDYETLGELMEMKKHPGTAKIFYEASKVERGHFKRLQKTIYKLYGTKIDDECEVPFGLECEGGFGDDTEAVFTEMSEEEAIKFLERVERKAEEFYLQAEKVTDRLDLKPLFRNLALEEHNHSTRVKKVAKRGLTRELPKRHPPSARPYH
ncbi:MAG: hypothetical protein HY098_03905 [Nitrospinae bacterium]|nr:hypothetical protein [Nitrospinota bacterium]